MGSVAKTASLSTVSCRTSIISLCYAVTTGFSGKVVVEVIGTAEEVSALDEQVVLPGVDAGVGRAEECGHMDVGPSFLSYMQH